MDQFTGYPLTPAGHPAQPTPCRYPVGMPLVPAAHRSACPAALANMWEPLNLVGTSDGSCVASTRVGIEVLRRVGLNVKPLTCGLMVLNLEAAALYTQGVPMSQWPATAWSLGIVPAEDGPWDAHLVVQWEVAGVRGLLDLDLGRYTRPEYGITTRSVAIKCPSRHEREVSYVFDEATMVIWTLRPELAGFKEVDYWDLAGDLDEIIDGYVADLPEVAASLVANRKAGLAREP